MQDEIRFKFRPKEYTIEAKFKQDEITNGMVCGTYSADTGAIWYYNYQLMSTPTFCVDVCASSGWKINSYVYSPLDTDIHIVKYEAMTSLQKTYHNGTLKHTFDKASLMADESTENLFIFGRASTTNTYKGRIYYLKVWNTSTEESICDLVPCVRNSDSAAGFWDKTRLQFLTNTYWSAGNDT